MTSLDSATVLLSTLHTNKNMSNALWDTSHISSKNGITGNRYMTPVYTNSSKFNDKLADDTREYLKRLEDSMNKTHKPKIKKVIFNNPVTIVLWEDGSKTVVKCGEYDNYDPEKGIAMAFMKKCLGNKGNYYNEIKKHLPKED